MSALDCIHLSGVTAQARHGVYPAEHEGDHPFVADVDVFLDMQDAAASDELGETIDYARLADLVHAVLAAGRHDLIEHLAQRVAAAILSHPRARTVRVTIHKPDAPISVPFQDVGVTLWRGEGLPATASAPVFGAHEDLDGGVPQSLRGALRMVSSGLDRVPSQPRRVVIALGANLSGPWGDPVAALRFAIGRLRSTPGLSVARVSDLVKTAAVTLPGAGQQPEFVNAVALCDTTLSPRSVLAVLQALEHDCGRERSQRWAARTLDLDLIDYEGVVACDPDLTLPHPRAHERAFVLVPWLTADAEATFQGQPLGVLADQAADRDGVIAIAADWLSAPRREPGGEEPAGEEPGRVDPFTVDAFAPGERALEVGLWGKVVQFFTGYYPEQTVAPQPRRGRRRSLRPAGVRPPSVTDPAEPVAVSDEQARLAAQTGLQTKVQGAGRARGGVVRPSTTGVIPIVRAPLPPRHCGDGTDGER